MRRLLAIALLALALAACGSSGHASGSTRIEFGLTGGNIRPGISVSTDPKIHAQLTKALAAGLASRRCPGTLPDVASEFIRFDGRTITVHGACEPRFTRLWNELHVAAGSG